MATNINWHGPQVMKTILAGVSNNLNYAVDLVNASVVDSMLNEQKTGRMYKDKVVGWYQASAPGQAPAVRRANLLASLDRTVPMIKGNRMHIYYGSDLRYAKFLEFGTRKMAPRPYLSRALMENYASIQIAIGMPITTRVTEKFESYGKASFFGRLFGRRGPLQITDVSRVVGFSTKAGRVTLGRRSKAFQVRRATGGMIRRS